MTIVWAEREGKRAATAGRKQGGDWRRATVRVALLLALGASLLPLYRWFVPAARAGAGTAAFGWLLTGVTVCYLAACALILRSRPLAGAWVEVAIILLIGVAVRAIVFGIPPVLSHDAYRYAWDPQVLAHGFSPYTHTPFDPILAKLRDRAIWPNVRYRDAPTIYPPAAQALFLVIHLVSPLNIFGVKAGIEFCDALSCLLVLLALRQRRLDLRRVLIYWWAPIPIIEFALNAHVDAEAILWTLGALVVSELSWRGARMVTGVLLGLAALTKLYPLLFALALIRKRDYGLLAGLLAVIVVGYAPFIVLGLGAGGFLGTYFSQHYVDQGYLLGLINDLVAPLASNAVEVGVNLLALALACGLLALYRWRIGLDPVAGLLAISIAWILLSPHIYAWYIAALLPLVALARAQGVTPAEEISTSASPRWLGWGAIPPTARSCWLFALLVPYTYILFLPGGPSGIFSWFFLGAAALGLAPLLARKRRVAAWAALRRLCALPTADEWSRLRRACIP